MTPEEQIRKLLTDKHQGLITENEILELQIMAEETRPLPNKPRDASYKSQSQQLDRHNLIVKILSWVR